MNKSFIIEQLTKNVTKKGICLNKERMQEVMKKIRPGQHCSTTFWRLLGSLKVFRCMMVTAATQSEGVLVFFSKVASHSVHRKYECSYMINPVFYLLVSGNNPNRPYKEWRTARVESSPSFTEMNIQGGGNLDGCRGATLAKHSASN